MAFHRDADYQCQGVRYLQGEDYFLVRCDRFEVSAAGRTPGERQVVEEHRWWSLDDLRTTVETAYPVGLVAFLENLDRTHVRRLGQGGAYQHVRVETAADHRALVPTIAGWHWTEWGHADPDGSAESWARALATRTNRDQVPTTWIALSGDQPIGSVSLVEHDMPDRPDLGRMSPWLAGLYVVPSHRRIGVATQLVKACELGALKMGIRRVYLYSSTARLLYERLGWQCLADDFYEGETITIMAKDLS